MSMPLTASSLPWRSAGILLYSQAGEQASSTDELLATFTDPAVADAAAREHNGALAGL